MERQLKKRYRLNRQENFPAGYQEGFTRPCKDRHSRSSHNEAICLILGSRSSFVVMILAQNPWQCRKTKRRTYVSKRSRKIRYWRWHFWPLVRKGLNSIIATFLYNMKNSQKILEEKFWSWTWICLEDPLSLMHRFKVENGKVTYQSKYLQSGMWMWFLTLRPSPNLEWLLKNFNLLPTRNYRKDRKVVSHDSFVDIKYGG